MCMSRYFGESVSTGLYEVGYFPLYLLLPSLFTKTRASSPYEVGYFPLYLLLPSLFTKTRASSPQILLWQNIVLKQINLHYGIAQGDVVDTHEHT